MIRCFTPPALLRFIEDRFPEAVEEVEEDTDEEGDDEEVEDDQDRADLFCERAARNVWRLFTVYGK